MTSIGQFPPDAVQYHGSKLSAGALAVHDPARTLGAISAYKAKPMKAALPHERRQSAADVLAGRLHCIVMRIRLNLWISLLFPELHHHVQLYAGPVR